MEGDVGILHHDAKAGKDVIHCSFEKKNEYFFFKKKKEKMNTFTSSRIRIHLHSWGRPHKIVNMSIYDCSMIRNSYQFLTLSCIMYILVNELNDQVLSLSKVIMAKNKKSLESL